MALAYLYEPEIQYQTKDGRNNTNGFLRVYLAATDDPATTYSDFNGTLNQQDIRLDDDGRAVVIVDNSKAYRLEVYDPEGTLLFTCSPVTAVGGGGGSGTNFVQVISSDGTVSVSSSTSAGTRYFDLSVAIDDNKPSKWADRTGTATLITGDGEWHELGNWVDIGTTVYLNGWQMGTDAGYDVAGSLEMLSGDADALSSIDVRFLVTLDGVAQVEEFGRIDPTKDRDRVSFEWKQEGLDHQVVNARIFVRASEDMDVSLVSRACYNEEVDGIVGNDSGSYIAGDYIEITGNMIQATGLQPLSGMSAYAYESSLSSKLDASASSEFYPTSNPSGFVTGGPYVYESSYSSFSSEITDNISSISSIVSAISGQTGDFVEKSSISAESAQWNEVSGMSGKVDETAMSAYVPFSGLEHDNGGKITAISGSGLKGHEYTGVNPVWVDNTEDKVGVYHRTLAVDETMTAYDSGDSAVIGVNTAILSGYAQASSLDDYQLKSAMTAYASVGYVDSGMSGKLDVTASSLFLTSLPADLATTGDVASAVSGKLDNSASGEWYPKTGNPSGFLTAHQSLAGYATEQYVDSSVSGKLDSTAYNSAQYYLTSNPSGFIDAASASAIASAYQVVSATATQLNAGTAYLTSVNDTPISAARAGNAANASLATSAWYDGTGRMISALPDEATVSSIASSYAESAASGKQDTLTFAYDDDKISSINGSALVGQGGATGDYVEKSSFQHNLGTANTVNGTTTASVYLLNGSGLSANLNGSFVQLVNGSNNTAMQNAFINGYGNYASAGGVVFGINSTAGNNSLAVGASQNASDGAMAIGAYKSTAKNVALSVGNSNSASGSAFTLGNGLNALNNVCVLGKYNSAYNGESAAFVIGDGYLYNDGGWKTARHDLMLVTKDGEITMYSSTADTTGTGIMSSIRAISAAATGGVDSATVSAVASSYAESAASSKLDTTAQVVTSIAEAYPATGGTFISQINGTNIFAVTAHSAGDWIGASSKVDQSAYDNLYSAFTALNDLISQYSAYFSSISAKVDNSAIGVIE